MEDPAGHQVVVGGGSGNKLSKIALIIFGLLILVVVSEFAYLWYTQKARPKLEESGITEIPIVNNLVAETPLPEIIGAILYPEKAFVFAEHIQRIKDLGKEEFIRSAWASYSIRGNVVEAVREEKEIDGVFYGYKIKIENTNKDKTLSFRFTNQEIETAIIFSVTGDKAGQKLNFEEIKPGYFLSIKFFFDLLDSTTDSSLFLEVSSFGQ